jgi:hypothetical protein
MLMLIATSQTLASRRRRLGPHCRRAYLHEVVFGANVGMCWTLRRVRLHSPGLSTRAEDLYNQAPWGRRNDTSSTIASKH